MVDPWADRPVVGAVGRVAGAAAGVGRAVGVAGFETA